MCIRDRCKTPKQSLNLSVLRKNKIGFCLLKTNSLETQHIQDRCGRGLRFQGILLIISSLCNVKLTAYAGYLKQHYYLKQQIMQN